MRFSFVEISKSVPELLNLRTLISGHSTLKHVKLPSDILKFLQEAQVLLVYIVESYFIYGSL